MKNTGKPYEALTEQVFKRLLAQSGVCVEVQRDTKIQGKSGTANQVDVSFTFVLGGTRYLTIVQCKDWTSPVKKEQVLTFKGVLDDIPGQPRGIMVSRSGFQEGAQTYAEHHGIRIYELRDPKDEDWVGLIQRVEGTMKVLIPETRNVRCTYDEPWITEQLVLMNLGSIDLNLQFIPGQDHAVFESGEECNMRTMLDMYASHGPTDWYHVHHEFPSALLVDTRNCPLPQLRITAVDAEMRVTEHTEQFVVSVDHFVAYCFRDVLSGVVRFLDRAGVPFGGG
jgi:hypothetical protein